MAYGEKLMTPVQNAQQVFEIYAGMPDGILPKDPGSALQVKLARWQARNFGAPDARELALGACEEVGELSQAILKHAQRIRGMEDDESFREAAGDAIADVVIFLTQLATLLRMDLWTLYERTAEDVVLRRSWKTAEELCPTATQDMRSA